MSGINSAGSSPWAGAPDAADAAEAAERAGAVGGPGTSQPAASLADPPALKRDGAPMDRGMIAWRRADGELFVGGPEIDDPTQGRIGDCYFVASIAALAQRAPELVRGLVRERPDGTFGVTLHQRGEGDRFTSTEVRVDRDVLTRTDGGPTSGQALYATSGDEGELWPSIVEKAFAQVKGGYDEVGYGGFAKDAFEALTGKPALANDCGNRTQQEDLIRKLCFLAKKDPADMLKAVAKRSDNADSTWSFLAEATRKGDPMVASTYPEGECTADGLMPAHAYTVMGVEERGGERFVKLRNPAPYTADLEDPALAAEMAEIPELKQFADLLEAKGVRLKDLSYGEFEVPFEAFRRSFHTIHRAPIGG